MRIRRVCAAVTATALAFTGACSATNPGSSGNSAGVLNVGMPNGPQTENNNPFLNSSASSSLGYRRLLFEPLAMVNEVKVTDQPKPWLATKFTWSENFHKLSLTIRDGVAWSDGKPLTAEDVAYTFELLKKNPGLNIEGVPYQDISFSGSEVAVSFPKSQFVNQKKILEQFVVPKHQWSTFANPSTETLKEPIGSGPYTLKSFTPQTVTLSVRDKYWQELPKVKELRYTSYSDNNAQTNALATGAAEWSFTFIPNYQAAYTSKDPQNHKLWFPPVLGVHGLWFNTKAKPWDDPALRRAANMVVNRDDIFMQGEAGYFYPKVDNITGIPTPAGESFIAPQFKDKKVTVDVEGAKKALTEAGYTFDGNTLKGKDGAPVTITLTVPSGWSDYVTDLEIIKDNFAKIGIAATVNLQNADAWTKALDTGDFGAAMHWTNNGLTLYDIYQSIMDGALYKPIGTPGVNGNYGRYENGAATKALDDFANAPDESVRNAALHELQKIFVQDMPVIITSAANGGGQYSTKNWVGWPSEQDQYAPVQPTLENALDIVLKLRPAS